MRTSVVVWTTGILTVILLLASFAIINYKWVGINETLFIVFPSEFTFFPLLMFVRVSPLGIVLKTGGGQTSLYPIGSAVFTLDILFLITFTLALTVTGTLCVFISPLSRVANCEDFRDAAKKFQSMVTKGTRKQKELITGGILITLGYYALVIILFLILPPMDFDPNVQIRLLWLGSALILSGAGYLLHGIRHTLTEYKTLQKTDSEIPENQKQANKQTNKQKTNKNNNNPKIETKH